MRIQNLKRIFAILLIISCTFYISPISFASSDVFDFNQYNHVSGNQEADKVAQNAMGTALRLIRTIAIGVSIIMLSYIGIKYMSVAPSEKAEFKKSATIYILGAILVFAGGNILGMIASYTQNNIIS